MYVVYRMYVGYVLILSANVCCVCILCMYVMFWTKCMFCFVMDVGYVMYECVRTMPWYDMYVCYGMYVCYMCMCVCMLRYVCMLCCVWYVCM